MGNEVGKKRAAIGDSGEAGVIVMGGGIVSAMRRLGDVGSRSASSTGDGTV